MIECTSIQSNGNVSQCLGFQKNAKEKFPASANPLNGGLEGDGGNASDLRQHIRQLMCKEMRQLENEVTF